MIRLTQSHQKTNMFLQQLNIDCNALSSIDSLKEHTDYRALKSLYVLEEEKEHYKQKIRQSDLLEKLIEHEKQAVHQMLSAFEVSDDDFCQIKLQLNPYSKFTHSSFTHVVQDEKKVVAAEKESKYVFIPKHLAMGTLIIDDKLIRGSLNFLISLKEHGHPFTIASLIKPDSPFDSKLLILKIKKLMLLQTITVTNNIEKQ